MASEHEVVVFPKYSINNFMQAHCIQFGAPTPPFPPVGNPECTEVSKHVDQVHADEVPQNIHLRVFWSSTFRKFGSKSSSAIFRGMKWGYCRMNRERVVTELVLWKDRMPRASRRREDDRRKSFSSRLECSLTFFPILRPSRLSEQKLSNGDGNQLK